MSMYQTASNLSNLPLLYWGYTLLILLVCITALIKVYQKWHQGRYPQGYRMVQGLVGLTILRLMVFLFTFLFWKADVGYSPALQVLDQASYLIGLILILWMWSFPEPSREADPITLGLIILFTGILVLQTLFVPSLLSGFTGTFQFWQILSLGLTLVGIGIIIYRKPNFWLYGILMGGFLGIGSILSLVSNNLEPLHLAQLTAYPLLLLLGERFPIVDILAQEPPEGEDDLSRRSASVDYPILEMIQFLFDEHDSSEFLYKIAQVTSYLILADLTLVIDSPDDQGKIRIIGGYDLIREESMQAITLDSKSVPLLSNYIQRGKMLHIPASSTSRDLSHLSKMLQLTKPGHLLASPVQVPGANKTIGVVLFSPFSNRPWTKADQDYLRLLCQLYVSAFSFHLARQREEPDQVKHTIRDLSSRLTKITQDKQQLKDEMVILSKDHQNLLLDQDKLRTKYEALLTRDNSLQRHLEMLVDLSSKESVEALRKYITVIEKELEPAGELYKAAMETKEPPALEKEPEEIPDEIDPASQRGANLKEAIQVCLEDVKKELKEKKIKTKLDLPPDPPLLQMNHALFQEIFSFLIANAMVETKSKGEIHIRTQIYEEDQTQHFAHIKVTDQGDGYFPDEIAAVLNNNLTVEQQEKLTQVMTNLYVTKNLVENEGGRMWVESKPGEGTIVSLLLAFQ